MINNKLNDIVTNGLCIGCGLCESVAGQEAVKIVMTPQRRERPSVRLPLDAPINEAIYAVCPGTQIHGLPDSLIEPETQVDSVWGPLLQIHRGYAAEPDIRFRGSTGGVLTALAIYLLESKRVDFILHVAADEYQPMRTRPHISYTRADVLKAAGSRYGPAAPLKHFLDILARKQPFAFIGKPCDIGAIRNLAKKDPRVDQYCRYLLTLVCGGASELGKSQGVLHQLGVKEEELTVFRYRGYGNPGKTRLETRDGRAFELTYNQMWDDERTWQIQYRCKICADAIGESADIAASDVWPGGGPSGEDAGFNGILARTKKGVELVEAAVRDGALIIDKALTARDMDHFQPHQVRKKRAVWARIEALRQAGQLAPNVTGLRIEQLAQENPAGQNEKEMASTTRRLRDGQFREPIA